MRIRDALLPALLVAAAACATAGSGQANSASSTAATGADQSIYQTDPTPDADGIGKLYMGREIARVMGYQGAAWLERPERADEERPDQVVANLGLAPDAAVADIGAGTGYFTFRISGAVPRGRVYAVDIQPQMLEIIERRQADLGVTNVTPIRGTEMRANLPDACCDVALMVDVYHELSFPREMMQSVVSALKPGGRLVLVEYRGEDPSIPIRRLHKMTEAQARREMSAVGLDWRETLEFLPSQHFMVFEKPAGPGS